MAHLACDLGSAAKFRERGREAKLNVVLFAVARERRDGLFASGASPVLAGNAWSQLVVGFGGALMVPHLVLGKEPVRRGEGSIARGICVAVRWGS